MCKYEVGAKNSMEIDINVSNLYVGMIAKNYIELCKILDISPVSNNNTNGKKAHIKEFQRYFDFERQGREFVITKIYDNVQVKKDNRSKGNNSKYTEHINLLVLHRLTCESNNSFTSTKARLLQYLGMVNIRYNDKQENQDFLNSDLQMKEFDLNVFYQRVAQKLDKTLFDSLNIMKRNGIIDYDKETAIVYRTMNGESQTKIANEAECKYIDSVKAQLLIEMGLESMTDVYLRFKGDTFYSKLRKILFEENGWDNTYIQYSFALMMSSLTRLSSGELAYERETLNKKILEAVNQQAQVDYEKTQAKYEADYMEFILNWDGIGNPRDGQYPFKYSADFVGKQKEIADHFIRL